MHQSSYTPTRKVGSAGLAGALSVLVVWLLNDKAGITVPADVASAITTCLMFGTAYFVSDK